MTKTTVKRLDQRQAFLPRYVVVCNDFIANFLLNVTVKEF